MPLLAGATQDDSGLASRLEEMYAREGKWCSLRFRCELAARAETDLDSQERTLLSFFRWGQISIKSQEREGMLARHAKILLSRGTFKSHKFCHPCFIFFKAAHLQAIFVKALFDIHISVLPEKFIDYFSLCEWNENMHTNQGANINRYLLLPAPGFQWQDQS